MRLILLVLLRVVLLASLAACAGAPAKRTLYDDLGGQPGIDAIAEQLLVNTSNDPRIARHFRNANIVRLHEKLTEMLCVQADGPCTYTGASMEDAHAGRGLQDADFNALVENLIAAMETLDVPRSAQFRLLDKLAAMHGQVIVYPAHGAPRPR